MSSHARCHDGQRFRAVARRCCAVVSLTAFGVLSAAYGFSAAAQSAEASARQQQPAGSAQREQIALERGRIEAAFALEQKQCYQRFAVNDCLRESRARRRSALAPLRQQEIEINDLERERRAVEQRRKIAEREGERARQAAAKDTASAQERARTPAPPLAAPGSAGPRHDDRGTGRPLAPRRESDQANAERRRADEAAKRAERAAQDDANALRTEQKLREAAEHKAKVLHDNAAGDKKPAAPLPLPPAAALPATR